MQRLRNVMYSISPHLEHPTKAKNFWNSNITMSKESTDRINNSPFTFPSTSTDFTDYYYLKMPFPGSKQEWDQYYLKLFYNTIYFPLDKIHEPLYNFYVPACNQSTVSQFSTNGAANRVLIPGIGDAFHALSYSYQGFNVLATDFSSVAIDHQKKINNGIPMSWIYLLKYRKDKAIFEQIRNNLFTRKGKIDYLVHDVNTQLPNIDSEWFGTIFSSLVWRRGGIEEAMLKEHYRVLAKGGLLYFKCHNITGDILIERIKLLESIGFIVPNHSVKALEYWWKNRTGSDVEKQIKAEEVAEKKKRIAEDPSLKVVLMQLSSG